MSATAASATDITGAIYFDGGSTNYFDSSNHFVPPGYGNDAGATVTVGSEIEFGITDGANLDTANFSATSLILTDVNLNSGAYPYMEVFTASTPGYFNGIQFISSDLPITFNVAGDTLTVSLSSIAADEPGTYTTDFSLVSATSAAPEPGTWALMFGGLAMIGGMLRIVNARRRENEVAGIAAAEVYHSTRSPAGKPRRVFLCLHLGRRLARTSHDVPFG